MVVRPASDGSSPGLSLADVQTVLREHYDVDAVTMTERHESFPGRYVLRMQGLDVDVAVKLDTTGTPHRSGCAVAQRHVAHHRPGLAPAVVPTRHGAGCASVLGQHLMVSDWRPGRRPAATAATWSKLGTALAELHTIEPAPVPFAVPVLAAADEIDHLAQQLSFDDLPVVADRVRHLPAGRIGTVHGELNLSNVIEGPDGQLTVIDWDQAGQGSCSIDLGYPLICVFADRAGLVDQAAASAFYSAYRKRCPLPDPEEIFTAALMHAARYLPYGDTSARCQRLRAALAAERTILRGIRSGWRSSGFGQQHELTCRPRHRDVAVDGRLDPVAAI